MYKNILIATDGSELAQKAVNHGLALAKALGAKVSAIMVTEPWTAVAAGEAMLAFPVEQYESDAAASAKRCLDAVKLAARSADIPCETRHIPDRFPAEGITAYAKDTNCDLIVMASHGRRGLGRLLMGSQTLNVLTYSTVPVLVCR